MTLPDPKASLESVYDEELGLRLANFSIKPVHVANGLARELTGRSYDTIALARTLRRHVRSQRLGVDQERNPNQDILRDYGLAFESLHGGAPDDDKLHRLRSLAADVLGADGAVFEQPDKSSYTLSNEHFITRDPSDQRAGLFLARLLRSAPEDKTEAADTLVNLLVSEGDAWTTLAWPLLELAPVRTETLGAEATSRAEKSSHLFSEAGGCLESPVLSALRDSYDRLARFEVAAGSKLNSLRRLMLFGCFAIHVHCIARWSECAPGAPRPPILLDLSDGSVLSVRDASRATLRAAGDSIEGLVRERFSDLLAEEVGSTRRGILAALETSPDADRLKRSFETYIAGGSDALESMTRVFVEEAFDKMREPPIGHLIELGRRAGFLSPWHNQGRAGKLRKRYTATAEFLEILIASTVDQDQPLEFPEFLDRLRETFGVVVGRPEDDIVIRRNNLYNRQFGPTTAINEEDLRANVEEMRRLVVESGYAKSYADGRTMVTMRPEGQL